MGSIPAAIDSDDPLLDPSDFFEQAARFDALDYVGSFLNMSSQRMFPRPANYDDDVIAEVPTFLQMATYEDPIDDLAIFFEKAGRWACCKRLAGPDGTFYLFAELPCEIRLMIWRQCIPDQIHLFAERIHEGHIVHRLRDWPHIFESLEVDYDNIQESKFRPRDPRTEIYDTFMDASQPEHWHHFLRAYPYHSRYCNPDYPMAFRQKTPIIAKVNQEARVLALECKSKCYNLAFVHRSMSEMIDRIEESPVWLNVKTDTVLVNTHYITSDKDRQFNNKANRLYGMITRNSIQVAIFAAVLIDSEAPPHLYRALAKANRVDVVVGVLRFHGMSDNEAAITDLFGQLGEQSMALIPAKNPQCLLKLFMAHAAFRPQCAAEYFYRGDALDIERTYVPEECANWDRRRRPSDFHEYCQEMLGFATSIMTACKTELMSRHFTGVNGEAVISQWQTNVEASFDDTFEPVFLVHRCRNPVLINFRKQEDGYL